MAPPASSRDVPGTRPRASTPVSGRRCGVRYPVRSAWGRWLPPPRSAPSAWGRSSRPGPWFCPPERPGTPNPCSYLRSVTPPLSRGPAASPGLAPGGRCFPSPSPGAFPPRPECSVFISAVSPSTDFVGWHGAGPNPIRPSSPPFLRIAAKPHLCYSLLRPLIYVQTLVHPANSYLDSNSVF